VASAIPWSQIEAECGDFRAGFVATYRKYQGQPTDERNGQNRVVKVTISSFARHMGIAESTFREWVGSTTREAPAPERRTQMDASSARRRIRQLPAEEKQALARELIEEQPEAMAQAIRADRKMANAAADALVESNHRAVGKSPTDPDLDAFRKRVKGTNDAVRGIVQRLGDAKRDVEGARAEYERAGDNLSDYDRQTTYTILGELLVQVESFRMSMGLQVNEEVSR
jgi:transposase-like protein